MAIGDLGAAIDRLRLSFDLSALPRLEWGSSATFHTTVGVNDVDLFSQLQRQFPLRLGARIFEGTEQVKELRGSIDEVTPEGVRVSLALDTQSLRAIEHRVEIDFLVEYVRWFNRPAVGALVIAPGKSFVDVAKLLQQYTVEELCASAEAYFATNRDNPWLLRKPMSLKDIQHNWPQVAALVGGLRADEGMKVLDFGAGTGWISRALNQLGLEVTSLDVSETALSVSRRIHEASPRLYPTPPMEFVRFDGKRLPFADATFDRIVCNDAFHHVPNPAETIAEMARVLKPGGTAGFCEPGKRHSVQPRSQEEMRRYTVVENDIDLELIDRMARSSGFKGMRIGAFTPYATEISLDEWRDFRMDSPAARRYLRSLQVRMQIVSVFFLDR